MSFDFPSLRQFQHVRRKKDKWRRDEIELRQLPAQHRELVRQTLMFVRADNRKNHNYDKRFCMAYKKGLKRIKNGEDIPGVADRIYYEDLPRTLRSYISRVGGLSDDTGNCS